MLKEDGRVIGDFSLAHLDEQSFLIVGSGIAEDYHMRWFEDQIKADEDVDIEALGLSLTGLTVAGPKSRDVLARLTEEDVSHQAFNFMAVREMDLGMVPAIVGRVSYTGDLGYEIWVRPEYQLALFHKIMEAGADYDIQLFGGRALNALRLEKNFGSWGREFRPIYTPSECGLDRFVAFDKDADFIGKHAAKEAIGQEVHKLRSFVVSARDADVIGDEPISYQGEVVGWVTSGGFAHGSDVSMAQGYVRADVADEIEGWHIELLAEQLEATLQPQPIFDANFSRMRS